MSTQPTTDITIPASRSRKSVFSKPTKSDSVRWHMFREKRMSFEEIAELQHVDIAAIEASVDRVEAYRALTSNAEISAELNSMVMDLATDAKSALRGALKADHVIRRTTPEGASVEVSRSPDDKTRLAAFTVFQKLADRNLPKGGGVNVAVQQNVNASVNPDKHISFEELLRQRREAQGLSNGDSVQEADYVDVDESDEEDEDGDEE